MKLCACISLTADAGRLAGASTYPSCEDCSQEMCFYCCPLSAYKLCGCLQLLGCRCSRALSRLNRLPCTWTCSLTGWALRTFSA